MLSTSDLIDWFTSSPAGKQLVAEKEAEHLSTRQALVEQLGTVRAEREKSVVVEHKAIAKSEAELSVKQDASAAVFSKLRQLQADRHSSTFRFDREVQDLERKLRETGANEEIDAFIAALRDESRELCHERSIETQSMPIENHLGDVAIKNVASNLWSIRRRLEAISRAIADAEQLRFSPAADITAKLAKIRDGLPPVVVESDYYEQPKDVRRWTITN